MAIVGVVSEVSGSLSCSNKLSDYIIFMDTSA
jgi:hypothetical protein